MLDFPVAHARAAYQAPSERSQHLVSASLTPMGEQGPVWAPFAVALCPTWEMVQMGMFTCRLFLPMYRILPSRVSRLDSACANVCACRGLARRLIGTSRAALVQG